VTDDKHRHRSRPGEKVAFRVNANAFFGGVPGFEHELVDGMNRSLARIKAVAES
jgi:hypothetical protein